MQPISVEFTRRSELVVVLGLTILGNVASDHRDTEWKTFKTIFNKTYSIDTEPYR